MLILGFVIIVSIISHNPSVIKFASYAPAGAIGGVIIGSANGNGLPAGIGAVTGIAVITVQRKPAFMKNFIQCRRLRIPNVF